MRNQFCTLPYSSAAFLSRTLLKQNRKWTQFSLCSCRALSCGFQVTRTTTDIYYSYHNERKAQSLFKIYHKHQFLRYFSSHLKPQKQEQQEQEQRHQLTQNLSQSGKERRTEGYLDFCDRRWEESFDKVRELIESQRKKKKEEDNDDDKASTNIRKDNDDDNNLRDDDEEVIEDDDIRFTINDDYLRRWWERQKHQYQRRIQGQTSFLTDERLDKLKSLNVNLESRKRYAWDVLYDKVCDYWLKNNNKFPGDDVDDLTTLNEQEMILYKWCSRQRVQYGLYQRAIENHNNRNNDNNNDNDNNDINSTFITMTPERIGKLNAIGFVWDRQQQIWDQRYQELIEYKKHTGDCIVPMNYEVNPKLAKWVDRMRTEYSRMRANKPNSMTPERVQLLNDIDFAWDAMEAKWNKKYKELELHIKLNGVGSMPRYSRRNNRNKNTNSNENKLFRWVQYQKESYNKWINGEKSTMTEKRKKKLDELGIIWD